VLIIFMSLAALFAIGAFTFHQLADSSAIPSDDQQVLEMLYRGLLSSCLMLWCFFEAKNALKIKENFILKLIQILSAIFFLQSIAWVIFLVIDYKLNQSLTSQFGGVASLDLSIRMIRAGIFCTLEILLSIYWVQHYSLNAIEESRKQEKIQQLLLEKDVLIENLSNRSTLIESGALSAGLAHELNQFLGRIALNRDEVLQLISQPGLKLEDLKLPLDNILKANHSAANLIASLRKLFNRGEEDSTLCFVDELVKDVVMLYASRIQKSHIEITMDLQVSERAYVWESLFRQVVANLLSNAIEALDGTNQSNKTIRIESRVDGNGDYCLIICDNGPGIDLQLEPKIFNLFASTKSSGTGIGLWLSRYIVERHKGSLTYQNLPNNTGISFISTVPMGANKLIRG
jgi:signal transduction histidine kinase